MLMKLTKGTRDYILKAEKESYWDKAVQDAKEDLAKDEEALKLAKADSPGYDELVDRVAVKNKQLEELTKTAERSKSFLNKYGPTIWKIHSVDKISVKKEMSKIKVSLGKFDSLRENELTASKLAYVGMMSYAICNLGIDGWSNLLDPETREEILFDQLYINQLQEDVATELANAISGVIDPEDIENLD